MIARSSPSRSARISAGSPSSRSTAAALYEQGVKLAIVGLERARQAGTLHSAGSRARVRTPSSVLAGVQASRQAARAGCKRQRTFLEMLDALKLARRQRLKLGLQMLDALAQLPQPRGRRRGRRSPALRVRRPALVESRSRKQPGASQLRVVCATRAGSCSIARSSSSRSSIRRCNAREQIDPRGVPGPARRARTRCARRRAAWSWINRRVSPRARESAV